MPARAVFAAVVLLSFVRQTEAADLWHWQDCPKPGSIRVTVEADHRRIADATIPVCRVDRTDFAEEKKQRVIAFPAHRAARRLGVHDEATLSGNIWEAGAESSGLVLGISFQSKERTVLNSLHFADAAKPARSEVAPGIIVRSSAVRPAQRARH